MYVKDPCGYSKSMTSTVSQIRWSGLELTMRDFVDDCRDTLPVLLITKTGYSGYDEDVHQIGAGEIYWVYEIQRQKRIVARQESENKFLSIPSDYPLNVQVIKNGKLGPPKSIKDLTKMLMSTSGDQLEIQFDNNQSVSFQVGADLANATQFGTLFVEDSYEEKYLLAYTIHGGHIFSKTVALPVYMDITVSLAEGLANGGDDAAFDAWTEQLKTVAQGLTSTPAKMCQEIILFNETPSRGEYEYLKPAQIANLRQKSSVIDGKPTLGGQHPTKPTLNLYAPCPGRPAIQATKKLPLPAFPRRQPPTLPCHLGTPSSPVTKSPGGTPKSQGGTPPALPAPRNVPVPALPTPAVRTNKVPGVFSRSTSLGPTPNASCPAKSRLTHHEPPKMPSPTGPSRYEQLHLGPSTPPSSPARATDSPFDGFESFEEIPVDMNFSGLSVGDISRLLSMMNLGSHCEVFEGRSVDGELLMQLDEDILVKDFGFSSFDARKLMMFTTKGWRPKKT